MLFYYCNLFFNNINHIDMVLLSFFTLKRFFVFLCYFLLFFFVLKYTVFSFDFSKFINRFIFVGANSKRDIADEYKKNFNNNQQLCFIDIDTKQLEYCKKMDIEEYKNKKFINKIPCMFLHKENSTSCDKRLVIYFGGNGETIYNNVGYNLFNNFNEYFDKNGVKNIQIDFLIVGYPGYGCSSDEPNSKNFYTYSNTICKYLNNTKNTSMYSNVYILGFSLGCAMAIDVSSELDNNKVCCLIIINPFSDIQNCVSYLIKKKISILQGATDAILKNLDCDFDNVEKIKKVKCDINIIFSENDNTINNKNSKDIYKNAQGCKMKYLYEIPGDHCDWIKKINFIRYLLFKDIIKADDTTNIMKDVKSISI